MLSSRRVVTLALSTRAAYTLLVLVIAAVVPDHDSSSSLLGNSCSKDWPQQLAANADNATQPLQDLIVWDSIYYERIARCGYEWEEYHAFFPLVPHLFKYAQSMLLAAAAPLTAFALAGVLVNVAAFALAVHWFMQLSRRVLQQDRTVAVAVVLYCLQPASVFHTMPYTESVYGCACMLGLYLLYVRDAPWLAAVAFTLSTATRSNGILNTGFLLHYCGQRVLQRCGKRRYGAAVGYMATGALCSLAVALPYMAFQYFGYQRYCRSYHGSQRPWCDARVPNLYGFVQQHYWGVGFLRYYQLKQLPNFALAAPVLALSIWGVLSYALRRPGHFVTGGLLPAKQHERGTASHSRANGAPAGAGFYSDDVAVFIYHWLFMALVGATVMHVQVSTRFLSSCAPLFWFIAHQYQQKSWTWLWYYSFVFMAAGAMLFPNFYPWT